MMSTTTTTTSTSTTSTSSASDESPRRTAHQQGPVTGWWRRQFARRYDALNQAAEDGGIAQWRSDLLAAARGDVVEIGAGTGANLRHYPAEVDRLTLVEPDPTMREQLQRRMADLGTVAAVVDADAEDLPLDDSSVDTVVCAYVLCSVDLDRALSEIARVLRPDGRLLFLEHVRSSVPREARRQDRWDPVWSRFAVGCHCNRDLRAALEAAGFRIVRAEEGEVAAELALVRPTIRGEARLG